MQVLHRAGHMRIAEERFESLDASITRVGARECPVAYHPDLEDAILPQPNDLLQVITAVGEYSCPHLSDRAYGGGRARGPRTPSSTLET